MINMSQIKKFMDDYKIKGIYSVVKDLLMYTFIAIISVIILNPDIIVKSYKEAQDKNHAENIERRLESDPIIRTILNEMVLELGCNRAFVCEFHNGTNNFAGLPFLYIDMKYEVTDNESIHVDTDYTNFNLTRYSFIPQGIKNGYWAGTIDDMRKIDSRFASRLDIDNSEYSAFMIINGLDNMVGVLGLTYDDANKKGISEMVIKHKMIEASQKIGILLSPIN